MKNLIYTCLWFNNEAKEAAAFYCSVFRNSVITDETPIVVTFKSSGQKFMCLNGGPMFKINPSVSFFVLCETEAEVEHVWKRLLEGGSVLMPWTAMRERKVWVGRTGTGLTGNRHSAGWRTWSKFTPALMFTGKQNGKAEQAIRFYTSVFDGSSVTGILKYESGENEVEGTVKHAQFKLGEYVFMAMDSSLQHQFSFNEAVSFVVECNTQEDIDNYWNNLTEGRKSVLLKDQFGVSWQIVPAILGQLMSDPSSSERVINAFLQMRKFDIKKLIEA
jgi:predicted 3-demethylubiquinone-9 3-methyltransferase (glyoxalase superfamily)